MITYRYGPYNPEEDNDWGMDRLMGILSEIIMKHDLKLDEALEMLLNRGLPVNLFLKEAGLEDLASNYAGKIEKRLQELLEKYSLKDALQQANHETGENFDEIKADLHEHPASVEALEDSLKQSSVDELLRLKWELMERTGVPSLGRHMDRLIRLQEEQNKLQNGASKYKFRGEEQLSKKDALKIIEHLDEMSGLRDALNDAVRNGDLFNFNLENLARYLGPESYEEFIERREEIFRKIKEALKEKGLVLEDDESGEMRLSPGSIRRIGRRAVEEIFAGLKSDETGGTHETDETGESENVSSKTKPMEFGDLISNMDIPASIVNAYNRNGSSRPGFRDIEIFESRGRARASTITLLDMSGSMLRGDRFYNAKKVAMSLDSIIRSDYKDDQMRVVGFGTTAKQYQPSQIPTLRPFPVTLFNPHIRLRIDMSKEPEKTREYLPLYFTNLQRGLQMSRTLLGSRETKNKQIILITDGVPTAHFEDSMLHINYPPSPADFEGALREVRNCTDEGIVINTFLLTSDWEMDYFGEESFIKQFARQSMGRIFYPHPTDLNKMILLDFIANRKKQFAV